MTGELEMLFAKIGAGIKTKTTLKAYKIYKTKKDLEYANIVDANNMYPEPVLLAKKERQRPLSLKLPR